MNWLDLALKVLGLVVGALLPVLLTKITNANVGAANAKSAADRAKAAGLRLAGMIVEIAPVVWVKMEQWSREAFADGTVSAKEREEAIAELVALIPQFASKENLDQLASDMGVPFSSVVGRIAAGLVERWAAAHTPSDQTVSAVAYPVGVPLDASVKESGG